MNNVIKYGRNAAKEPKYLLLDECIFSVAMVTKFVKDIIFMKCWNILSKPKCNTIAE